MIDNKTLKLYQLKPGRFPNAEASALGLDAGQELIQALKVSKSGGA